MTVQITCPTCGEKLIVADKYAGKTLKCPGCESRVAVPSSPALPPINQRLRLPEGEVPAHKAVPPSLRPIPTAPTQPDSASFDAVEPYDSDPPPSSVRPRFSKSPGKSTRYPALRIIAIFFFVVAIIVGCMGLLQMAAGLVALGDSNDPFSQLGGGLGLASGFATVIAGVLLLAISEGIKVSLDIEENTRNAFEFLRDRLDKE